MVDIAGAGVTMVELGRSSVRALVRAGHDDIANARSATAAVIDRNGKPEWPGVLREIPRLVARSSHDPGPVRQELFNARNSLVDAHRGLENLTAAGAHFQLGVVDQGTRDAITALGHRVAAMRGTAIDSSNAASHVEVAGSLDQLAVDLKATLVEVAEQVRG